jgi:hypothetical protein
VVEHLHFCCQRIFEPQVYHHWDITGTGTSITNKPWRRSNTRLCSVLSHFRRHAMQAVRRAVRLLEPKAFSATRYQTESWLCSQTQVVCHYQVHRKIWLHMKQETHICHSLQAIHVAWRPPFCRILHGLQFKSCVFMWLRVALRSHLTITNVKINYIFLMVRDSLWSLWNIYGKSMSNFQNPHTNLTLDDRDEVIST